jgi:hypothetical protein
VLGGWVGSHLVILGGLMMANGGQFLLGGNGCLGLDGCG